MKKIIASHIIMLFICLNIYAQEINNYQTPWYGVLSFHYNAETFGYKNNITKRKMAYADMRIVVSKKRIFAEGGMPITSYFLTKLISNGSKKIFDKQNGEISITYLKMGYDIYNSKRFRIGLGGSFDYRQAFAHDATHSKNLVDHYGMFNPLVYSKIAVGPALIVPTLEYVFYAVTNSNVKRPGLNLNTHVMFPLSDGIAIHLITQFESGTFKYSPDVTKTKFIGFNIGIIKPVN